MIRWLLGMRRRVILKQAQEQLIVIGKVTPGEKL